MHNAGMRRCGLLADKDKGCDKMNPNPDDTSLRLEILEHRDHHAVSLSSCYRTLAVAPGYGILDVPNSTHQVPPALLHNHLSCQITDVQQSIHAVLPTDQDPVLTVVQSKLNRSRLGK